MTLLDRVADFENLMEAYNACSRGKRNTLGYHKTVFNTAELLLQISQQLLARKHVWGQYRRFYVTDPKTRLVMAAPFLDRVVHHAIHQVIEPLLDKGFSDSIFACRTGRGNRFAAQHLIRRLKLIGPHRYALKLDVRHYFASIDHTQLLKKLCEALPDDSLNWLLETLIASEPLYRQLGKGIPIGNLTSQLFANFYLSEVDRAACLAMDYPYFWLNEDGLPMDRFYVRYMDDLVLFAKEKALVCQAAQEVFVAIESLALQIPVAKRMHLGAAPIPFLGYLISHDSVRPLMRNQRKFQRRHRRLIKWNERESIIHKHNLSYHAWADLSE